MKKKILQKITGILIVTLITGSVLAGCGQTDTVSEQTDAVTEAESGSDGDDAANVDEDSIFGQITAIEGDTITVALAEMPERSGQPSGDDESGEMPSGEAPSGDMPEDFEGESGDTQESAAGDSSEQAIADDDAEAETTDGEASSEANGEMSQGETPSGEMPSGEAPSGEMPSGGGQMELTLTGEEQTITVTDATTYLINGEEGSLDDLQVDDTITIVLADDGSAESISSGMGGGGNRGGGDSGPGGEGEASDGEGSTESGSTESETSSVDTAGANEITDSQSLTGILSSQTADESVVVVKDGGDLTLEDATITKSGETSDTENSEFYGLNAALLVKEGSTMTITGSDITTNAEGANAIFATGEDAVINVSNVTIKTTADSSRGLDATYGGSVIADQATISTAGAHCAAVATDWGEGTIEVTDSSLQTAGEGSPCVYSTGNITVSDSSGTASGSSAAVVEGKNSITLNDCSLVCEGIGRADGGIDDAGVMVYQSMSGDAGEGTGNFTSNGSTLTVNSSSEKYSTAPMFFVTNTDAVINLTNTELNFGSGILLNAAGNDGEWGTAGSNGGTVTFTAESQELEGDITADEISTVDIGLTQSTLTGSIDHENTAKAISLTLDAYSKWELTADSYVTSITNADTSCGNISSNGYTIYYDASNEANSWLNGETVALDDGGSIAPM